LSSEHDDGESAAVDGSQHDYGAEAAANAEIAMAVLNNGTGDEWSGVGVGVGSAMRPAHRVEKKTRGYDDRDLGFHPRYDPLKADSRQYLLHPTPSASPAAADAAQQQHKEPKAKKRKTKAKKEQDDEPIQHADKGNESTEQEALAPAPPDAQAAVAAADTAHVRLEVHPLFASMFRKANQPHTQDDQQTAGDLKQQQGAPRRQKASREKGDTQTQPSAAAGSGGELQWAASVLGEGVLDDAKGEKPKKSRHKKPPSDGKNALTGRWGCADPPPCPVGPLNCRPFWRTESLDAVEAQWMARRRALTADYKSKHKQALRSQRNRGKAGGGRGGGGVEPD